MVTTINRALNASKLFHCPVCIGFQGSTRWKFENCAARNIETDCHMILWTWTTLLIVKVLRSTMPRIAVPVPPGVKGLRASNCVFRMRFADLFGHGGLVSVGLYAMHFVFFGWLLQFSLLWLSHSGKLWPISFDHSRLFVQHAIFHRTSDHLGVVPSPQTPNSIPLIRIAGGLPQNYPVERGDLKTFKCVRWLPWVWF